MELFYEVERVPVHSVLLMRTRAEALNYPKGDLRLGLCRRCGFIGNLEFDPGLHEYSGRYEETQGFSPTFNEFHRRLAEDLIERYGIRGKKVIEIGCGKGEFLALLCELGGNRGMGFDPAYVDGRLPGSATARIDFVKDFYSEKYSDCVADVVCCKMTLEHIHDVAAFVATVRRAIGDRASTAVFFQVPDTTRILREIAFWDIYYEHCSYFTPCSLGFLFSRCGFEVMRQWTGYGGQYLMIEARPGRRAPAGTPGPPAGLDELAKDVERFTAAVRTRLATWRTLLANLHSQGRRAVLWGGGSKAVAFLTTLGIRDEVPYAVDINPYKQGTFLPGPGQEIVAPGFLAGYKPDLVILMNPNYREEVSRALGELQVPAELMSIDSVGEQAHAAA
jgi:hypothetical protein